MRLFTFVVCCTFSNLLIAQLPTTNIFHFEFRKTGDSLQISKVKLLTKFNQNGYNNQPYFFSDQEIYLSSDWQAEMPDILKLDLGKKQLTRVTKTKAGEFSPTLLQNKSNFAVIRQESDGQQFLWSYPLDLSNRGKNLLKEFNNIGYFNWFNSHKVAIFAVGNPHQLILINKLTDDQEILATNVGRTLIDHAGSFYYVQKHTQNPWEIIKYNLSNKEKSTLIQLPSDVEDFAIAPNGSIYCGEGSYLLVQNKEHKSWTKVADLKAFGINKISRIKIRKNKMCLVDVGE